MVRNQKGSITLGPCGTHPPSTRRPDRHRPASSVPGTGRPSTHCLQMRRPGTRRPGIQRPRTCRLRTHRPGTLHRPVFCICFCAVRLHLFAPTRWTTPSIHRMLLCFPLSTNSPCTAVCSHTTGGGRLRVLGPLDPPPPPGLCFDEHRPS